MTTTSRTGLWNALLAVQKDAPAIQKTKINPAFRSKYVSLDSLMETVMPVLNKHGLVWTTLPGRDEYGPTLTYELVHAESGESLEGTMPLMLAKSDPQGQGSGLTYARRYSLMAVLGLVADEDDDGAKASQRPAKSAPAPVAQPSNGTERIASAKQRGLIFGKAGEQHMPASVLANVVLAATGADTRDFVSEDAAQAWLQRALDRLPAKHVDKILAGIEEEAAVA